MLSPTGGSGGIPEKIIKEKKTMRKNATAKAFVMSILSLMLCLSMLVGTTFAWFTDSVTSGVNKIVAGNLDVNVYYTTDPANEESWKPVSSDTGDLFQTIDGKFGAEDLWEPGHMEVVYLKIVNEGTLALKYQISVDGIDGQTGTTVPMSTAEPSNEIYLSHYLKFGQIRSAEVPAAYTRETALEAVEGVELGLQTYSDISKLEAGDAEYVSLVVYMPDTVGNEANSNDKDNRPTVDLTLTVLATQFTSESDSFGPDYDANADGTDKWNHVAVAQVGTARNEDGSEKVDESGKPISAATALEAPVAPATTEGLSSTAEFPEGALEAETTYNMRVDVENFVAENKFEVGADNSGAVASIDLNLFKNGEKVSEFNGQTVTVTTYISKSLNNVTVEYNGEGEQPTDVQYDPATGKLTFKTTHFSEYIVKAPAVAYIEATDSAYTTLQAAIDSAADGDTILLLTDLVANADGVSIGSGVYNISGKTLTIDGNGKTISAGTGFGSSASSSQHILNIIDGANVTVKSLTIDGSTAAAGTTVRSGINVYGEGSNTTVTKVTVKNVGAYGLTVNQGSAKITNSTLQDNGWGGINTDNGGTVTVSTGGTYQNVYVEGGSITLSSSSTIVPYAGTDGSEDATLTIKKGRYEAVGVFPEGTTDNSTITITGGYFNVDPSAYVTKPYYAKTVNPDKNYGYSYYVTEGTWSNFTAESYVTPVDEDNKVILVSSAEELALFASQVETGSAGIYNGYTLKLTNNIDLEGIKWKPMDFWGKCIGLTFDGQNHTISNLFVADKATSATRGYGAGFIGNASGAITIKDVTFDHADVCIQKSRWYNGNVVGIVMAYSYGNVEFNNVNVTNSEVWGYGKIGAILGMAADPSGTTTFSGCRVENTTICAYYNAAPMIGLALNDVAMADCSTNNVTWKHPNSAYMTVENAQTLTGTKPVNGIYWVYGSAAYAAWSDYYNDYYNSRELTKFTWEGKEYDFDGYCHNSID